MHGVSVAVFSFALAGCLATIRAQDAPATTSLAELQGSFAGSWAGTLEYRDYSEPATSTKRVKLPTWLTIEPTGGDLRFRYVYDDGPSKTVKENSIVRIDPATAHYTVLDHDGKIEDSYVIGGLAQLRSGRGVLTLTGSGTENGKAVDVRTTVRVGRNILEITRETAVSGEPFTFRHAYTLVRASAPGSVETGK